MVASMEPSVGSVVGGKYRLERPLARGGMGSVWAGHHLDLDVPIAVKFMGSSSPDLEMTRARFAREAKAAASLRSPHVVKVLDYDAAGDAPYIVMELLVGEDLGQRLAHRGRLSLAEVDAITRQLALGLGLAHDAGIVHRDLKPSNVFLARVGSEEVVTILDFGVAKETKLGGSDAQTTTGLVIGSPSYMSPEQARGGKVDLRSDLWSLGVLLFQALTGKRPFEGPNVGDVLVRICSDAIPLATHVAPDLPPEIDGFFARALCRSPDGRFQDARSLAAAFAAIASQSSSGEVISAGDDALAPRNEPTRSVAIRAVDLAGPTKIERTPSSTSRATTSEADDPRLATTAGASSMVSTQKPAGARSDLRGVWWGLGGAAVVASLWLASQSGLLGIGATAESPVADVPAEAAGPSEAAATPDVDLEPPPERPSEADAKTPGEAPAPSAAPPVPTGPSSTPVATPAPMAPAGPRPTPKPPPPPPPATKTVDPKFGLPVGQ